MLGPSKPRRLDDPVTVSLEALVPADSVAVDILGGIYVDDNLAGRVQKFRLLPPLAPADRMPTA